MATTMNPYSVLLVEDNPDLVMGLQDLLHHDGYAVTVAGTVAGALELVRAHRFNAIILDLGLPDGDGLEVLKETQRLDPSLPVVVVTAHISQDRTVRSLAEGAFAYLTKPYDREELRHTLRRAIGVKELAVKVERTEHLLNESEERLELVIQGSNDGFWDGRVLPDEPWSSPRTPVWWSPRVKAMLGYTDKEFPDVLESWASRLHPEDTDRVFAALTAHIERRDPYDEEYRLLTKAGEYGWFRARGQAIWDETGRMTRMAGSLQDVTDRKRAEDALHRSEQLLHDVINNTTAVIYAKYTDGRYLLINRRFEQLFHLTTDQIVGHTDHEIFPKDIADAFRANDVTVSERNTVVEYEEYAPHSDGLHAYISIKFPLCDPTGKPYATCGISTDITERKRIEDTLRTHEQQLRLALTAAPVGLWDWDLQTGQLYWSPQVDRLLGVAPGSVRGTQNELLALVHPDDREIIVLAIRHAAEPQRADVTFEHRVLRPDGSVQWCVWTGEIIRDCAGKALHILGTVRATAGSNP
jgi:PAS domain S-box-containing protein